MIDKQRIRTFILGGVVGALVGIIFAPRSGKELRGSVAERAGEARERGRENYFETQERLRERLAEMGDVDARRPSSKEEVTLGVDESVSQDPASEADAQRPRPKGLRDVSRQVQDDNLEQRGDTGPVGDRSEELRRKVRETRDRLKKRSNGSNGGRDE